MIKSTIFILAIFLIALASASDCSQNFARPCDPDPGYVYCHEVSWTCGEATSYSQVQASDIGGVKKGGYYIGEAWIDLKFKGDKFYWNENVGNLNDYLNSVCGENGCQGNVAGQQGRLTISDTYNPNNAQHYTDCPVFYAWDRRDWNGWFVYSVAAYGWSGTGNCLDIKTVNCYDSSDCGQDEYCDRSGDWTTWNCKQGIPCPSTWTFTNDEYYEVVDCAVWQYVPDLTHCSTMGWYVYNPDTPGVGNLVGITDTIYQGIAPSECWQQPGECQGDGDCPATQSIDLFCSGNNVMETIRDYSCVNQECVSADSNQLVETCDYGCLNAQCLGYSCTNGEKKCEDSKVLKCVEGSFEVEELCGNGCLNGSCINPQPGSQSYLTEIIIAIGVILLIISISFFVIKRRGK